MMTDYRPQDDATRARAVAWDIDFSEALELIQMMRLIDNKEFAGEAKINGVYGEIAADDAARKHFQNQLAVKLMAIFGKAGDSSTKAGAEIAKNEIIDDWRPLMLQTATALGVDAIGVDKLIERLRIDRNKLNAHRDGKHADVLHDRTSTARSISLLSTPDPLTEGDLSLLEGYIKACIEVVRYGRLDHNSKPVFPLDITSDEAGATPLFNPPPFGGYFYQSRPGAGYSV